jgi:uncharacterized protein (DUF1501 family)
MMRIDRRQFLKGASASAVLAGSHVLGVAARRANAATPDGRAVVLIDLAGGNDYLNTVVPLDDVGAPQRATYAAGRADLAIPPSACALTEIGTDPAGTALALHPQMVGLATLFAEGKLAVVNGVGYPQSSLSHFEAEAVWWAGNPNPQGTGWMGRYLDQSLPLDVTHALSFGSEVNPTFAAELADAIGARNITRFELPPGDAESRLAAWQQIYADAHAAGLAEKISRSGANLLEKSALFESIQVDGWGSNLEPYEHNLAVELRQVASILRHDQINQGSPSQQSGVSFFHLDIGGFDTHSEQGALDPEAWHPTLLRWVSEAMTGFQRDLEALGLANKVVTLTYSEFSRRIEQNSSGNSAGTDHGRGSFMFVMGDPTILSGGIHGAMPDLSDPDEDGNIRVVTDFRQVYAAVIDQFLGGDPVPILGSFSPLPLFI